NSGRRQRGHRKWRPPRDRQEGSLHPSFPHGSLDRQCRAAGGRKSGQRGKGDSVSRREAYRRGRGRGKTSSRDDRAKARGGEKGRENSVSGGPVLCGEGLCKTYGKRPVLRDVTVEVYGGEVVAL